MQQEVVAMLTAERKNHLSEFPLKIKFPTALLMTLLFFIGFWVSTDMRLIGITFYLLLWLGSYGVIYAGACRDCVYYGKRCPIPLEGSGRMNIPLKFKIPCPWRSTP